MCLHRASVLQLGAAAPLSVMAEYPYNPQLLLLWKVVKTLNFHILLYPHCILTVTQKIFIGPYRNGEQGPAFASWPPGSQRSPVYAFTNTKFSVRTDPLKGRSMMEKQVQCLSSQLLLSHGTCIETISPLLCMIQIKKIYKNLHVKAQVNRDL